MFRKVAKRIQLLLKNVMIFDTFLGQNAKTTPKVSRNDRFYKGFRNAFLHFENLRIPVALLSFWTFWKRVAKTL